MEFSIPVLIAIGLAALCINYAIIMYAVRDAQAEVRQHMRIQTSLLGKMAAKAGVSEEEIQESFRK